MVRKFIVQTKLNLLMRDGKLDHGKGTIFRPLPPREERVSRCPAVPVCWRQPHSSTYRIVLLTRCKVWIRSLVTSKIAVDNNLAELHCCAPEKTSVTVPLPAVFRP